MAGLGIRILLIAKGSAKGRGTAECQPAVTSLKNSNADSGSRSASYFPKTAMLPGFVIVYGDPAAWL
jgi:hypothetical protein